MENKTLYRKWRPQSFSEVVGQKHVAQTLVNAIEAGRLSHAYLFTGTRGTGKTSVARILAKSINCEQGPTANPCERCEPCQQIKAGNFLDVIEIDAASNRGIDDVRALREQLYYSPSRGRYKVYIIDEVHMLTPEASNALLKVLEEPPSKTVFILATTEAHKVLPTILSRCQRFDFRRLAPTEIVTRLKEIAKEEGIKVEESALWAISSFSQGSLRDALVMLEQGAFYSPRGLKEEDVLFLLGKSPEGILESLTALLLTGNFPQFLSLSEELYLKGYSFKNLLTEMLDYFYALLLKQEAGIEPKVYPSVNKFQNKFSTHQIGELMEVLSETITEMRYRENSRLAWESAFFKIFKLLGFQPGVKPEKKKVEKKVEQGGKEVKPVAEKEEVYFPAEERLTLPEEPAQTAKKKEVANPEILTQPLAWDAVLKEVKTQKPSLYFMLLSAKCAFLESDTICLNFKPDDRFPFKEVSSRPNLEHIEKICHQLSGRKIKIKCCLGDKAKEKKGNLELKKEKIASFLEEFEAEPIPDQVRKEESYEPE